MAEVLPNELGFGLSALADRLRVESETRSPGCVALVG
jgi:hypothetical protein